MIDLARLLISLVLLTITFLCIKYRKYAIGSSPAPGNCKPAPGFLPVIGHAIPAFKNLERWLEYLREMTPPALQTYYISIPFIPTLVTVTQPRLVQHVLKDHFDSYVKGPFWQKNFMPFLGKTQGISLPLFAARRGSVSQGSWVFI